MKEIITTTNEIILVDDEDYIELSKHSWGTVVGSKTYAGRGTRKKGCKYKKILMHRVLLNVEDSSVIVDHINGNGLDNRKSNLRITNKTGNARNSKLRSDSKCKYKGVHKKEHSYTARIQIDTKTRLYLGEFKTEIEAALAYNKAAIKHFGEFANLNIIKK